jgi:hypothetical protein
MYIEGGGRLYDGDPDRRQFKILEDADQCYCYGCCLAIKTGSVVLGTLGAWVVFHNEECFRRYQENAVRNGSVWPFMSDQLRPVWVIDYETLRSLSVLLPARLKRSWRERFLQDWLGL